MDAPAKTNLAADCGLLTDEVLAALAPMHLTLSPDGIIQRVGPTLRHMYGATFEDAAFFDRFTILRPRRINDIAALSARTGTKLTLEAKLSDGQSVQMRGVALPLPSVPGGLLIDLAFGADMTAAIDQFGLTQSHFRANDPTVDLFYSLETQRLLLEDTTKLADELSRAKERAEREAKIDALTGIANRRAFHEALTHRLVNVSDPQPFYLLHIDLDAFKSINDSFGHGAGDRVLEQVAEVLKRHASGADVPARLGGDEFVLLLSRPLDDQGVARVAQQIIKDINAPIRDNGASFQTGASIGIVRANSGDPRGKDRLLMLADLALFEAKRKRNTHRILTDDLVRKHDETAALIENIKTGIAERQFIPYLQPQIDLRDQSVSGFEVLARWRKPDGRIVTPGGFLQMAMQANLLRDIDRQVRRAAILALGDWIAITTKTPRLSINVTAANLRSTDFVEELLDEVFQAGVSPASIQLELLESILFEGSDAFLARQCHKLQAAGFSLALDDFGSGHASISTLVDVPISVLKIDRSFVMDIDSNAHKQKVTGAMFALARHMGLDVLAEGVETQTELDFLRAQGCRYVQGYYFGQPMPPDEVPAFLNDWTHKRRSAS